MSEARHFGSKYMTLAAAWEEVAPEIRRTFQRLAGALSSPGTHADQTVSAASEFADQLVELSQAISDDITNPDACDEQLDVALDVICAALELLALYKRQRPTHHA